MPDSASRRRCSSVQGCVVASSGARLALALRRLSPVRVRRWALCTRRSRMASARSDWRSYRANASHRTWLVTMVEPRPWRSSRISSRSRPCSAVSVGEAPVVEDEEFDPGDAS